MTDQSSVNEKPIGRVMPINDLRNRFAGYVAKRNHWMIIFDPTTRKVSEAIIAFEEQFYSKERNSDFECGLVVPQLLTPIGLCAALKQHVPPETMAEFCRSFSGGLVDIKGAEAIVTGKQDILFWCDNPEDGYAMAYWFADWMEPKGN